MSSLQTDRTDNQEDDLIVDCVLGTQFMDQFISPVVDVVEIITNMRRGGIDRYITSLLLLISCRRALGSATHPLPWTVSQLPYSSILG